MDSSDTYVNTDKLVTTLGIKDLVIIISQDVCLVAHKDRVKDLKSLVSELEEQGRQEYKFSKEWLNIWWPHDEYMLLKLYKNNLISDFYKEAEKLLLKKMISHDPNLTQFKNLLSQSIMINYQMLKLPKRDENYRCIWGRSNIFRKW